MKSVSRTVQIVAAVVLALLLLAANIAMYLTFDLLTKLTNNMGLQLDSEALPAVQADAIDLTHRITEEGIVLLRNERQALPLPEGTPVNLFGWSSTALVVGGSGGSGGAVGTAIGLDEALLRTGFSVNNEILDMYRSFQAERVTTREPEYGGYSPSWGTPEPDIADRAWYSETLLQNAIDFSDIALMTVSRTSGEGLDIPSGYQIDKYIDSEGQRTQALASHRWSAFVSG